MLSAAAARPACAASLAVPPALADPSAAAAAAAHAASGMPALAACLYAAEPAANASASSRAAASAFCARRRAVCGTWTFSFQARGTLAGFTAAEEQKKTWPAGDRPVVVYRFAAARRFHKPVTARSRGPSVPFFFPDTSERADGDRRGPRGRFFIIIFLKLPEDPSPPGLHRCRRPIRSR